MKIYWGDLHNHCGITYGFGSLENAIQRARGRLDFCAFTGHAMRSVAHPYADRIARGCPDRPGVPSAIARPRFPGHLLHGAELLPVRLFFRAVQRRHRFEGEPDGGGGEERLVRKPFVGDRADRIGRRSRVRGERMNIRRVIPPVVSPVMCERTRQ